GESLLEDRRVRRHAGQRIVLDTALEIAISQNRAVNEVEPNRLAGVVQPLEAILGHGVHGKTSRALRGSSRNINRRATERRLEAAARRQSWQSRRAMADARLHVAADTANTRRKWQRFRCGLSWRGRRSAYFASDHVP